MSLPIGGKGPPGDHEVPVGNSKLSMLSTYKNEPADRRRTHWLLGAGCETARHDDRSFGGAARIPGGVILRYPSGTGHGHGVICDVIAYLCDCADDISF